MIDGLVLPVHQLYIHKYLILLEELYETRKNFGSRGNGIGDG